MARRADNEGTIYKKTTTSKGKKYTYWEAQVTIGYDPGSGKRIRKTYTGKTQKEVRAKMQNTSVQVQEESYFEPSKSTLSQWIDIWLREYCNHMKYQAKKSYTAQCETHIKPALGAIPLSKLSTPQIQTFYNELGRTGHEITKINPKTGKEETTYKPLSPKSIKNIHSILSKCLNTAIEVGYLRENPSTRTKIPKVIRKEIKPLTNDQVKSFIEELGKEQYSSLYKFIVFTGVRKAEALGLTWDAVNLSTGDANINKQLIKRTKADGGYTFDTLKNYKSRILSLPPYVVEVLKQRKAEQEEDRKKYTEVWEGYKTKKDQETALVFTTKEGKPINPKVAYLHYKKIVTRLGLDESRVHDLRHTYAVLALQNGDNIKVVQDNLGHATASFTLDIYGHSTDQMKIESASKMENFIGSITTKNDPQNS